jgi:hypothetical protein
VLLLPLRGGTALKRAYVDHTRFRKWIEQKCCTRAKATVREIQLPLDREEFLTLMQDSLKTLAMEMGLLIAVGLLEDEVTRLCGRRYQH